MENSINADFIRKLHIAKNFNLKDINNVSNIIIRRQLIADFIINNDESNSDYKHAINEYNYINDTICKFMGL